MMTAEPFGWRSKAIKHAALLAMLPLLLLLGLFFILPVLGIFKSSVIGADGFSLDHYTHLLTTPVYRQVLFNTLFIAVLVTLLSVLLSYPLAYLLATVGPTMTRVLLVVVLLPFWTSALVRTTAWIILLQRNGVLNSLLLGSGVLDEPAAFVYNLSGVLIGMTHVLMPFVVLPLYAAFRSLDRSLIQAAEGLGAGPYPIFLRIIAPLTAPGVVAGALIVFMNAIGYYITPALMGGPGQTMIAQMISFNILEQLDWGLAAALSTVLLGVTLIIFFVFQQAFSIDRLFGGGEANSRVGEPLSGSSGRRTLGGKLSVIAALTVAFFLILPVIIVFPMSLGSSPFLSFPPSEYSWRWYNEFFANPKWLKSLYNSLEVAALAVGMAVVAGTAAAIGVSRLHWRSKTFIEAFFILPLIIPAIVLAVSLYYFFAPLGLIGSPFGLALGHALLASPFVFITVRAALKSFDINMELAALGLGASWGAMFRRVMLPSIMPGIAAGAVFAFIVSFDDVILALFLTNIRTRTLPKLMFEGVAHEIDPTIIAVSALLILVTILILTLNILLSRWRARVG